MKTGDLVSYYTDTRYGTKQHTGMLISFDTHICMIVPSGKTKAIPIPASRVIVIQNKGA